MRNLEVFDEGLKPLEKKRLEERKKAKMKTFPSSKGGLEQGLYTRGLRPGNYQVSCPKAGVYRGGGKRKKGNRMRGRSLDRRGTGRLEGQGINIMHT